MLYESVFADFNSEKKGDVEWLKKLVAIIRPNPIKDTDQATRNILGLCQFLSKHPIERRHLQNAVLTILDSKKMLHALVNERMYQANHLWGDLFDRISRKILPPVPDMSDLRDAVGVIFDHPKDDVWVTGVTDDTWLQLFNAIGFDMREFPETHSNLIKELLNAIQYVSYQIAAVGLQPEFVRNYPRIEEFESPFSKQNEEVVEYVQLQFKYLYDTTIERVDALHIEVLLEQCESIVAKIRAAASTNGISVGLTRLLNSLEHGIDRIRQLIALLETKDVQEKQQGLIRLFKQVVQDEQTSDSVSRLWQSNTRLLTEQVTQCAGQSGEHYVTTNRQEWVSMAISSLKAGFFVGFMALIKALTSKLLLAPIGYALLYAMNYSFGFVLIHIFHGTLATKQPAMTASLIAQSYDRGKKKLKNLIELIVDVIRSQLVAIVCNILLAFPTAIAIGWAWERLAGHTLLGQEKALKMLNELDPFHGPALIYAAIAGVCLFVSGLISGYYDNKAKYNQIPSRIAHWPFLKRVMGESRAIKIADYIEHNLGALAGNFFLGIMLAFVAPIGGFLGLPIDIRHVTLSSANLGLALYELNFNVTGQYLMVLWSGVLLIGMVNLSVSFTLALWVALKSRGVTLFKDTAISGLVIKRFFQKPMDFIYPPKVALVDEVPSESADA